LESSNLAEMQAICNVLYIARTDGYVLPGDEVLIQTDCRAAIQGLTGFREVVGRELDAQKTFRKLSESIFVDLRHVKGHTSRDEARYRANHHCDRQAYAAMKRAKSLWRKGLNG
jgi:ribonuclease HI